jgi:hypothetical protein
MTMTDSSTPRASLEVDEEESPERSGEGMARIRRHEQVRRSVASPIPNLRYCVCFGLRKQREGMLPMNRDERTR